MVMPAIATTGAGLSATSAVRTWPLRVADTGTDVASVTEEVLTGKLNDVYPCGTVTLAGTDTFEAFALVSVKVAPPACAGMFSVTVAYVLKPPSTALIAKVA